MSQPVKKNIRKKKNPSTKPKKIKKLDDRLPQSTVRSKKMLRKERNHPEYGTSKLEEKFAREFLDKLGVKYTYQFKAESIGRYYDFRIFPDEGGPCIEIQGTYWHADPRIYEGKELTKVQKWDIKVDEIKKKYCDTHNIRLIYIWEKDINENPNKVLSLLENELRFFIDNKKKKKRH